MSKKEEKIDAKELAKELLNDRTHGAAVEAETKRR